jgi:hypothetical protein
MDDVPDDIFREYRLKLSARIFYHADWRLAFRLAHRRAPRSVAFPLRRGALEIRWFEVRACPRN